MIREISLSDINYFKLSIGDRILKKDIFNSKGNIPVYSSNVYKSFGLLYKSNISDFKHNYVLWGIDGDFNFDIKYKGEEFATTDHCGTIKILNSKIFPEYLLYQLELKKRESSFDRSLRPSVKKMMNIKIPIPFKNDIIDVKKQQELIKKYNKFLKVKRKLNLLIYEIKNTKVDINPKEKINYIEDKISNFFNIHGEDSKLTKKYIEQKKGIYPVYSGQVKLNEPVGYIDSYDLDGKAIIWTTYGSGAGLMKIVNGKFNIGRNAGGLKLKKEYFNKINLLWFLLKYENEFLNMRRVVKGQGRVPHTLVKDIIIKIPLNDEGNIDLDKQNEIADKYSVIENNKNLLLDHLNVITKIWIDI